MAHHVPDDLEAELFGYVEILSGIIRIGRQCRKMLDPFERSAAFSSVDGRTAVIKGLTAGEDDPFTRAEMRCAYGEIRRIGMQPKYFRAPRALRKIA